MHLKRWTSIPEKNIYIAADADVVGDVKIGNNSSVWYHAVIRGDGDSITIGNRTNIQDSCILHTDKGFPLQIGNQVTVGHRAILHGCSVGDGTLIGMGAVVLNGAVIGKNCIIGAGALVTQGTEVPDGMMAFGSPAKIKRELTEEEKAGSIASAEEYTELSRLHFG